MLSRLILALMMASPASKNSAASSKISSAASKAAATTSPTTFSNTDTFAATELSGHDSPTLPPLFEAAVLYSAAHYDAASDVLKEYLREPAGKNNLRAWLMLFDFYQLTNNNKEFDALSMLFTVKFERSPPVWIDLSAGGDPRRTEKRERKDFFQMKPASDGALLSEIDRLEEFVKSMRSARLDFSKIKSIQAEEGELFSIVLQRIRRVKLPIWFNDLDQFAVLLKKLINETPGNDGQGYWSLLFELYILDGKLSEYEDLGLEYAVAFEMSPPSWETVPRPAVPGSGPVAGESNAQESASTGFQMKGVFGADSKDMLAQLAVYAAARQEVVIDMGGVMRIDFTSAAIFFEAIRAIHMAQKRVILSNLNELVAALLEVFAANKHAILMRKKSS